MTGGGVKIAHPLSERFQGRIVRIGYAVKIFEFVEIRSCKSLLVCQIMDSRDTHHVLVEGKQLRLVDVVSKSFF